jgi:hypothetical protein
MHDLCLDETWMFNKPKKSFMQPTKASLPWLNSYRCHIHLYASLWYSHGSYCKMVDLCVWILFVCSQKLKITCVVVFRDEGTFESTTAEMLSREDQSLDLGVNADLPLLIFSEVMSQNTFVFDHLSFSWQKDTLKLNMFWDLLSSWILLSRKW